IATLVAVAACLLLAFGAGGSEGTGGMIIWRLFGATNQILASLTLLVVSVMLIKMGRPSIYTIVPMIFVLLTSFLGGVIQLLDFWRQGKLLPVVPDLMGWGVSVLVVLVAAAVVSNRKRGEQQADTEACQ